MHERAQYLILGFSLRCDFRGDIPTEICLRIPLGTRIKELPSI
jgi:hypothetical protein